MAMAKDRWTPHPRPDWVQKVNEEGYIMNISGVVPLDAKSLLNSAMTATGLAHFGADDWREPFEVLLKSLDDEADLNLIGRIRTRSELLQLLEARLQIEETYKRHPEIEHEQVVKPIIILGQGRGGTSFTFNMLSADPENGTLKTWEAIFPCPPPERATYETAPRIERAHQLIDQWNRVTPELQSMHEFSGRTPQDDCHVLGLNFMSALWFNSLGQVPSYNGYLSNCNHELAFAYQKRVLKLLQWKNPRQRWVLKDPTHIDHVDAILNVYPDACFVMPHRDPIKSQASATDLLGTIHWGRSDYPFKNASFDYIADPRHAAGRLNAFIDKIESGLLPKERLYNVQYSDLTTKSLQTVKQIYAHFGIPITPASMDAIARYLAENPRDNRPKHAYELGDSAEVARDRELFARYQTFFGVQNETGAPQ